MTSQFPSRVAARLRPDFNPAFFPRCDGGPAPISSSADRYDRMMLEFAEAYYELNRTQALLDKARTALDADLEAVALEQFCSASDARDNLEDRYAPEGVYAEPVKERGVYVDLYFQCAKKPDRPRVHVQQFSAEFTFET